MMKDKNVSSLEELIALAREMDVRMIACEMSRDVMGIKEPTSWADSNAAASPHSWEIRCGPNQLVYLIV